MKPLRTSALVALLALSAATMGAAAQSAAGTSTDHVTEIGRQDVRIDDLTITVADTHVSGTDLPAGSVDRSTDAIETATVTTDGFDVVSQDHTYRFCPITVTVDDVGLTIQNASVGEWTRDPTLSGPVTTAARPRSTLVPSRRSR